MDGATTSCDTAREQESSIRIYMPPQFEPFEHLTLSDIAKTFEANNYSGGSIQMKTVPNHP